ncbi:MAG: hypothetical protein ACI4PH_07935 [Faecousia sp.]
MRYGFPQGKAWAHWNRLTDGLTQRGYAAEGTCPRKLAKRCRD